MKTFPAHRPARAAGFRRLGLPVALAFAGLLTACGSSGGGDDGGMAAGAGLPASSLASARAFTGFIAAAVADDSAEPLVPGDVTPPVDDGAEPVLP